MKSIGRVLVLGWLLHVQVMGAAAQTAEPTATPAPEPQQVVNAAGELVTLPPNLLVDKNGDGVISIIAFGDSITRGVGDFIGPGQFDGELTFPSGEAGYPLRVENSIGIQVSNFGDPGELLSSSGIFRYARTMTSLRPDIVIFSEGYNDAERGVSANEIGRDFQAAMNIARALGSQIVVTTLNPLCCDRGQFAGAVEAYNNEIRALATASEVPIADFNQAVKNTCQVSQCFLLNLDEGLHPNTAGYDVYGEVVTATLLGIDILDPLEGPALFEQALMRPPGSTRTRPNPLPPPATVQ